MRYVRVVRAQMREIRNRLFNENNMDLPTHHIDSQYQGELRDEVRYNGNTHRDA